MTLTKETETCFEIFVTGKAIGYCEKGRGSAKPNEWRAAIYGHPIWSVNENPNLAAGQAVREYLIRTGQVD